MVVSESAQQELNNKFSEGLKAVQDSNPEAVFEMEKINFTRKFSEDAYTELCSILQKDNFVAIIDLAWGGWIKVCMHNEPGPLLIRWMSHKCHMHIRFFHVIPYCEFTK